MKRDKSIALDQPFPDNMRAVLPVNFFLFVKSEIEIPEIAETGAVVSKIHHTSV